MADKNIYTDPDEILALLSDVEIESEDEEDCTEVDKNDSDSGDDSDYIPDDHGKPSNDELVIEDDIRRIERELRPTAGTSKKLPAKRPAPPKTPAPAKRPAPATRPDPVKKKATSVRKSQESSLPVADGNYIVATDSTEFEAKNGDKWSTIPNRNPSDPIKTSKKNVIHIRPDPVGDAKQANEPIECFRLYFSKNIMAKSLKHTNEKIEETAKKYKRQEGSLQPVTMEELEALFGILYLAAALKSNHLTAEMMFQPEFCGYKFVATMSRRRFEFLISCLRFDDGSTREERKLETKFAAISEIWEMLIENCKSMYKPSSYVTIDEQLLAFRGRCPFKMYLPSKPCKYGIKTVMMCDNANKYMIDALPYWGKGSIPKDVPAGEYHVKTLVASIKGSNRNVTMDNWFTSVPLFSDLLKDYNLTAIGTV